MQRLWLLGFCAVALLSVMPLTAQQTADAPSVVERPTSIRSSTGSALAGAHSTVLTVIQGNALNSTNGPLPKTLVRLRDARSGRLAGSQLTDNAGLFSFGSVEPGTYIVELMSKDHAVLAASQLLSVGPGETISAVVKLPFQLSPLGGLFGHTVQQAAVIVSAAAASGVLAAEVTGVDASAR